MCWALYGGADGPGELQNNIQNVISRLDLHRDGSKALVGLAGYLSACRWSVTRGCCASWSSFDAPLRYRVHWFITLCISCSCCTPQIALICQYSVQMEMP